MLKPCSKDVKEQLNEEKQVKLRNIINQLGFVEGIDYNGEKVLKNNIPIRKQMTQK